MKLQVTAAEVAKLLGLKNTEGVTRLVRAGVLDVAAYTRTGRPVFNVESVLRAAKRVLPRPEDEPVSR